MMVTFREEHRQYFKNPNRPMEEYGADLWDVLIERSELIVRAKSECIDQEYAHWLSKGADGTSAIKVVCLSQDPDYVPEYPTHTCFDVLFIKEEDDAPVIKGIGSAMLHETKLPFPDMSVIGAGISNSVECFEGIVSIEYVKKLSEADWKYYKDLMFRDAKTLKLYHIIEERAHQERVKEKTRLKPKIVWPIISLVVFFVIRLWFWDNNLLRFVVGLCLVPLVIYVIGLIRYWLYKV